MAISVQLRDFREADLDPLRHWLQPDAEWHQWDAPYFPKADAAEIDRSIELRRAGLDQLPNPRTEQVIADEVTGALLGRVSWHWEHEPSAWARCGVTVYDPAVRGQGIGSQALTLLADYVFNSTAAHRLDFLTWSGNLAMCRVGEKLGWVREATFREAREVRGVRYHSVAYGILRSEWAGKKERAADTPVPLPARPPRWAQ